MRFAEGEKMRWAFREGRQEQVPVVLLCKDKWSGEHIEQDQGGGQKEKGRADGHIKAEERQAYTQQCQNKHRDGKNYCVEQ